MFEASGKHCWTKSIFKPRADPAHCGAPQRVKHSANHDRKGNDERQHQERIGAAARQDAIIDLKQIDGRSEKKEIVTAAIGENEPERSCAGPQGRSGSFSPIAAVTISFFSLRPLLT